MHLPSVRPQKSFSTSCPGSYRNNPLPFSTFNEFGAALCEAAGVAFPSPLPDPDNVMAFHLVIDGVIVNLIHHELEGNDDAFVLVVFGVVPEQDECEVLRVLAEMNFVLMSADAPVLGCNPETGEVVLRKAMSLSLVDAEAAFSAIKQLVAMALEWREHPLFALDGNREAGFPLHQRI
ncbi:hypothetical protein BH11PSE7_BH11PSE7_07520 [soil metagenome]